MSSIRSLVIVALAITQVADGQNVQRTKRGDTSVVVTQGNGRWGAPHDAIEVLRVPGDTKQTIFGEAYRIEALPDGGVLVVDTKAEEGLIVRRFDANGKFLHNIGRQGPGPGEYKYTNLSVTPGPKGSVYIRDDMSSVSVFGADGKLINSFALNFNNGSTTEIVAGVDGSAYVRAAFTREGFMTPAQRPFFHYDLTGKLLDSLSVSDRWLPEGAPGFQWWRVLPDGRILITRTDKVGFLIVGHPGAKGPDLRSTSQTGALAPAGEQVRRPSALLVGEIPSAPVPYLKEEREELQVARNLSLDKCGGGMRGRGGRPVERVVVPETKLPSHGASADLDGRIWVIKSVTAQKIPPKVIASCSSREHGSHKAEATHEEPPVFAAFLSDGSFLGEVRFPLRARVTFVGNFAWALVPDADDVQTLVKYRLY